jgi:hypothetical protein
MLTSDNLIIKGGASYSLESMLSKGDHLTLIYILFVAGLLLFINQKRQFNEYYFGLISIIFILMSFNNKFNINIEPYRFIPYLEIFVAIFSSYIIILFYKKISKNYKIIILPLILILALLFSYSNITIAKERINEFTKAPLGKLPAEDLKVMKWMRSGVVDIKESEYVCSLYKWGHWIPATAEKKVVYSGYEKPGNKLISCDGIFNLSNKDDIVKNAKKYDLKYVYFSSYQDLNLVIDNNFELLQRAGGASLYKLY